jgi:cation diffusion facilitator family transporter
MVKKKEGRTIKKKRRSSKVSLKRVVLTSFLVDVSDVALNVIASLLSGSVTMMAQALEGAADLLSSGLLLIGSRLSEKPPSERYPYGHGRELYFWTFMSGLATFTITAGLSFYWGLMRFLDPEPVSHLYLNYAVLIFAVFSNGYAFSLSYRRLLGKKSFTQIIDTFIHSAFIETKTTFILDLMGTVASLFGLISLLIYGATGNIRFDGVGAMATGLALAFFAYFILKGSKELLVGRSASVEVVEKIRKAVESFSEVNKVLDLRTLLIGPDRLLVNMEVHTIDGLTTDEIEKLIDRIEKKIKSKVNIRMRIQVELESLEV